MRSVLFSFILTLPVLLSCGGKNGSTEIQSSELTGTWTLYKESKNGETKDYSGVPTASKIEFKENGYYFFYDQITDEEISQSGVGTIQDNLKGQFELKGNELHLNHYIGDSLAVKLYIVESVDDEELILKDKRQGKTSYFRH